MPAKPDATRSTNTTLDKAISDILQRQRDDAQRHLADPGHWGNTGRDILGAVIEAENVVRNPRNPQQEPEEQVEQLVLELQDVRESWRSNEEDEHGFGSATLAEIITDLESLAADMKSD